MPRDYPYIQFYPSDWRADQALRVCSLEARGLWIEMLCIMHEASPYGHLLVNGSAATDTQLAALAGTTPARIAELKGELKAAGVFSVTGQGVIYSRRMTQDYKKRRTASKNGKKGGNPNIRNKRGFSGLLNPKDNPPVKPKTRGQRPYKPPNPLSGEEGKSFDIFKSRFPMQRSGNCGTEKMEAAFAAAVDAHGVEQVLAAGRAYAEQIRKNDQLPTSILKFLAGDGLISDYLPLPPDVERLYPVELGSSREHKFLEEMREHGVPQAAIARWARGGFVFRSSGDQVVAVVEADITAFQATFGVALQGKGIGCWTEDFYQKRERRKRAK